MKEHLILVGFMGSGKTTTAKELAKEFKLPFQEMDQLIEEKTQTKISDIFKCKGEVFFRQIEHDVLNHCLKKSSVIATGGGILTYEKSLEVLKNKETVIYLKGDSVTLIERIRQDILNERPLADSSSISEIIDRLNERETSYEEVADLIINIKNKTVQEITQEIKDIIKELN